MILVQLEYGHVHVLLMHNQVAHFILISSREVCPDYKKVRHIVVSVSVIVQYLETEVIKITPCTFRVGLFLL